MRNPHTLRKSLLFPGYAPSSLVAQTGDLHSIRSYTILLTLFLASTSVCSQQLERQVISAAGTSSSSSFTIGETIIVDQSEQLMAGFQQPVILSKTSMALDFQDISHQLRVYPNPAHHQVTISGVSLDPENSLIALYDPEGRKLNIKATSRDQSIILAIPDVPSGHYLLTIRNSEARTRAHFKLLKN